MITRIWIISNIYKTIHIIRLVSHSRKKIAVVKLMIKISDINVTGCRRNEDYDDV